MNQSGFSETKANLWKHAISRNVEESFKKFLNRDVEADDFQILIHSSFSEDTSLAQFSCKIMNLNISSFYVKLLTDKQTHREMPGKT